jgi:hypothetical protein
MGLDLHHEAGTGRGTTVLRMSGHLPATDRVMPRPRDWQKPLPRPRRPDSGWTDMGAVAALPLDTVIASGGGSGPVATFVGPLALRGGSAPGTACGGSIPRYLRPFPVLSTVSTAHQVREPRALSLTSPLSKAAVDATTRRPAPHTQRTHPPDPRHSLNLTAPPNARTPPESRNPSQHPRDVIAGHVAECHRRADR